MIALDLESSKLCTFGTPFGRFRLTHLPYGVNPASEISHKTMNDILEDIEGVGYDILIFSETIEGHYKILETVLLRAKQSNLKFKLDKCKFGLGDVRRFLGMVNYLS